MTPNSYAQLKDWITKKKLNVSIYLAIIISALLCYPTVQNLIQHWIKWDQALSHAIPTFALMGYLLWRIEFKVTNRVTKERSLPVFVALGLSSALWFLFQINHIELLSAIVWLALVGLYIAASFSWQTLKQLSPTLALMIFIIPIWPQLTNLLVTMSGSVVGYLIGILKIPAYIEGTTIQIPSGLIVIADGCSGLRYLIVASLLGYTIGLLNQSTLKQNFILLTCSLALALVANWTRIFALILIGYHSEMQSSLMQDHELFGWLVFSAFMFPAIYLSPVVKNAVPKTISVTLTMTAPILATAVLAIGPTLYVFANQQTPPNNPYSLHDLSLKGKKRLVMNEVPIISLEKTTVESRKLDYKNINIRIDLIKKSAAPDEKLVPYIDTIYDKEVWQSVDTKTVKIMTGTYRISKLKRVNTKEQAIFLQQFNVGKSSTGSYVWAKLLQLKARALNQQYFAMLILQAHCETDCENETNTLISVAKRWESVRLK